MNFVRGFNLSYPTHLLTFSIILIGLYKKDFVQKLNQTNMFPNKNRTCECCGCTAKMYYTCYVCKRYVCEICLGLTFCDGIDDVEYPIKHTFLCVNHRGYYKNFANKIIVKEGL